MPSLGKFGVIVTLDLIRAIVSSFVKTIFNSLLVIKKNMS